MTPVQQQRFNTIVGGIFIGTGVLAWLLAVAFAVLPNKEAPAPVTMAPYVDMASCAQALRVQGFVVEQAAAQVEAYMPLAYDNLYGQLEKASVAWNLCKVPVQSFCMGDGCEKPGMTLTLRGQVGAPRVAEAPAASANKK